MDHPANSRRPADSLRRSILVAGLVMGLATGPALADTASGLTHFHDGEFAEAQLAWRQAAQQGDGRAALYLGVSYDAGQGVPRDEIQALLWYRRAADAGNASGMFNLGVMYDAGRGTPRDPEEAVRWYLRAAEAGSARAEYNLGLMYQDGMGVPRDAGRAVRFFRLAARHGIGAARAHLAELGAPFHEAAARPTEDPGLSAFHQAQTALLTRGVAGATRAVTLFREGAERGDPLAAYNLGYCYANAIGVPQDRLAAYHWYRQAAVTAGDDTLKVLASSGADALRRLLSPTEVRQASLNENR